MESIKIKGFGGVLFWLRRVAEEHNKQALERLKRCQDLHFQTIEFEDMPDNVKKIVVMELVGDMINFGWHDSVEEYFSKCGETE